jgi:hypothetical protein
MKETIKLKLTKPARKQGGDRYEDSKYGIVFYLPQSLSRQGGEPEKELDMELTTED